MNARLDQSKRTVTTGEPSEWPIAVVYDDSLTRNRAMQLVRMLQKRFAGDIAFSCTWWRFRYLNDPDIALVARHYACAADIVVFSTDSPGLFSLPVMNWIESWAAARRKSGGVLVPLLGSPNIPSQLFSTKHFYLRHVAERSGMDYLPPSVIASAESFPSPKAPLAGSSQHSYEI
jgi:hypothetical protein